MIHAVRSRRLRLPGRAFWASATLLSFALLLAASMTRDRARRILSDAVRPEGWELSFRPPRAFAAVDPVDVPSPNVCHFLGRSHAGTPAVLAVRRLRDLRYDNPRTVAERTLELDTLVRMTDRHLSSFAWSREPVGSIPGAELRASELASVVRAVVTSGGAGYAIALHVQAGRIDDRLYRLFDHTCRSVRFDAP